MCLIAFAIQAWPGLPLLLAANRDEFFERPTAALHRWSLKSGTRVLAGRDLRDGGTWLGVSEAGRVAMLTNVRNPAVGSGSRSRGELATRWLQGALDEPAMARSIEPMDYAGFNLVLGDLRSGQWAWMSNCDPVHPHAGPSASLSYRALAPGVYGLSNASLDTPWPKTLQLKAALRAALRNGDVAGAAVGPLASALADRRVAAPGQLPQTGVALEQEIALSSSFVQLPEAGYGTRSSLVMWVTADRPARSQLQVWEWTHTPETPDSPHRWDDQRLTREALAF